MFDWKVASRNLRTAIFNGRPPHVFLAKSVVNLSYIILWLLIVILINHIPRSHYIFTKFLLRLDSYLFDIQNEAFGSISCLFCVLSGSWLIYVKGFTHSRRVEHVGAIELDELPSSSSSSPSNPSSPLDKSSKLEKLETYFNNDKLIQHVNAKENYRPYKCWNLTAPILLASSWLLINTLYAWKTSVNKPNNLVAWIFYVPLHISVPPLIAGWLYLFHTPGALKLFTISLGLQNILVALTQLALPGASPLFLQLYGETKDPDYDMLYTDGITRQDMKFGSTIYKAVYYVAPHKFATLPSVHASMSSLVFFFVSYYGEWRSFKLLALVNLCGQWWSVLYLDHHWRLDILLGLAYSMGIWVFIRSWKYGIKTLDEKFIRLRLDSDFAKSSTMGMRLFKGTLLQDFFDPLR
ncbi:uncharacterized protein CANTADRAFT_7956 [Suhomyces tanzawaensis NRRL Y-17324]|uniref:Inositolphosphotransferase Aur1/Ipt1 domain-containing protein n=1 Tax=Suhomyces tanzawaensis NRRL Y-17324 TaxID=984487 RepID=A0A1E4SDB5_9ASCO|nr:uncharacterized protein CANTADRAFT_7956 [Suhomyces tanzawaensis NRRL Y-17324]ODV77495.1 hypothetical protein CANTADRAFT_7956 [Suhomyces tanzawaensis NRRL Y-17324]